MEKTLPSNTLSFIQSGPIRTVTIENGPVNLMDRAMIHDLRVLLTDLQQDKATKVVVFRSANPAFFISHADLKLFRHPTVAPPRPEKLNSLNSLFESFRTLDKATIAVIEGRVNGAGTEFALSLDMRFAARESFSLGQFEVALGALPGGTGTQRIPSLAGRSRALELILGCDDIDANVAELYGLVNRSFYSSEIWRFVDRLAGRIASFPSEAITLAKRSVDRNLPDPKQGLLEESHLAGQLMVMEETTRRFELILARGAQTAEFERDLSNHLPRLADPDE